MALTASSGTAIQGTASSDGDSGVRGDGYYGVIGYGDYNSLGSGVYGYGYYGVYGDGYLGVVGWGDYFGIWGYVSGAGGRGVYGSASASSGTTYGVYGESYSEGAGFGVYGVTASDDYDNAASVWGQKSSGNGTAVRGYKAGGSGVAVRGTNYGSSGSGTTGVSTNFYGLWGESSNYRGVRGSTGRADNNYGLYTPDNLYSLNYNLMGAVMHVVQNGGSEALEPGDVVVFSGLAAPLEVGGPPVVQVARATSANSTAVAGVVYSRFNIEAVIGEPEQDDGRGSKAGLEVTPEGPVSPSEYLLLVVQGPAQVKAGAMTSAIQPGDLLSSAGEAGYAAKAAEVSIEGVWTAMPGTVFGKALEPLDKEDGLIYVFVTLQ
jgi:hypothetical protein